MLSPETCDFCRRWIKKADRYKTDNLEEAFDCFFSLFIPFNRLYFEAGKILNSEGISGINPEKDKDGAVKSTLTIIGIDSMFRLLKSRQQKNIGIITSMLYENGGHFHIILDNYGNVLPSLDQALISKLQSDDHRVFCFGVLELIYYVRCNMFHGHKGFNPIQVVLLQPIIEILKDVVNVLLEKEQSSTPVCIDEYHQINSTQYCRTNDNIRRSQMSDL